MSQYQAATVLHKVDVEEAYDSPTWWYDIRGFFILTFCYRNTLMSQIRFFSKNMGAQHLEVAVGSGSLLKIIEYWRKLTRAPKTQILAFDYVEAMLTGAREKFENSENIKITRADATDLNVPANTYDSINIANAFHCFNNPQAALNEARRVLKPGGKLAMNVILFAQGQSLLQKFAQRIMNWGMKKGILVTPYKASDVRILISLSGMEIVEEKIIGNTQNLVLQKRELE